MKSLVIILVQGLILIPQSWASKAKSIECSVKKISPMGAQYTIKPKKILLTQSDSANGAVYLKADLELESLGLPDETGKASTTKSSQSYDMDVTGSGKLVQAVSRQSESHSSIAVAPLTLDAKAGSFNSTLTVIARDSYFKGSPVKIDATLNCVKK